MRTMKAIVKARGEQALWLDEVLPDVGLNDVLIKVAKAAICGRIPPSPPGRPV